MAKYRNTFQQGVAVEDLDGHVVLGGGLGEHRGILRESEDVLAQQVPFRGIPMPGPGMIPDKEDLPTLKCVAITKKGSPCKAYAVNDSTFCVAHNV